MPADAANRKDCREELENLFNNVSIAENVYGFETVNVEGNSALVITSNGTRRMNSGINDTRFRNEFLFEVLTFVKKANTLVDSQTGTNWTERDVENKLDEMDKAIADVIADNRANNKWTFIEFTDDYSDIIAGRERFVDRITETIPYKVESRLILIHYIEA